MLANVLLSAAGVLIGAVASTRALIAEGFTHEQLALMRTQLTNNAHQRCVVSHICCSERYFSPRGRL